MKGIFSTSFAAPISYYKAMLECDMVIMEQHEHFIKQTIRNRCDIATSNGKLILTVPLSERKNNMLVKDVRICYKTDWQRQHMRSLATAYKSSPFFEFYIDELETIYKIKEENLFEWNRLIHQQIFKWLKINKSNDYTATYNKTYENISDYRNMDWNKKACESYHQVFENRLGFIGNLSILDLIFNCGNQSISLLMKK